jgi:hypothetical protein
MAVSANANEDWEHDPEKLSLPGFGDWSDQSFQIRSSWWDQERTFLAQSEIPWIRIRAMLNLIRLKYGPDRELYEEQYLSKMEETVAVMRQAPDDLFTQVALAAACKDGFVEKCQELGVYDRIIELDPDNVLAHLIPITAANPPRTYSTSYERASLADSPTIRKHLITASNANNYVSYSAAASLDWYTEHLEFVKKFPPPTAAQRSNPDYTLAFYFGGNAPLMALGGTEIVDLCLYYLDQAELDLISACERLALKLQEHHKRDGFTIADYFAQRRNPFGFASLRLQRVHAIFDRTWRCLQPRWLKYKSLLPSTRLETVEAYLNNQVKQGTWIAQQNAALLEYAENPSLYTEDPAECAGYLDLDSESLGVVLGDDDTRDRWLAAQQRAQDEEEIESEVLKNISDDELAELAAQLDHVEEVYDPVVKALGRLGMRAFPFLLDRLCADERLPALAAAWAIAEIGDTAILVPTLERMAEPWPEGQV